MAAFVYKLFRFSSRPVSTLGLIMADLNDGKVFRCFTLEDEYREVKVSGETRIPAGKYEIKLRTVGGMHSRYSKRFDWHKCMLWLQDVPGFEWIYIHPGNKHEHTEGCILTGDGSHSNLIDDGSVSSSVAAYERIYKEIVSMLDSARQVLIEYQYFP